MLRAAFWLATILAALAWRAPTALAQTVVDVSEFGALPDDYTDDTAAIQAAFDQADIITFLLPGTYDISNVLCVDSPANRFGKNWRNRAALCLPLSPAKTIIASPGVTLLLKPGSGCYIFALDAFRVTQPGSPAYRTTAPELSAAHSISGLTFDGGNLAVTDGFTGADFLTNPVIQFNGLPYLFNSFTNRDTFVALEWNGHWSKAQARVNEGRSYCLILDKPGGLPANATGITGFILRQPSDPETITGGPLSPDSADNHWDPAQPYFNLHGVMLRNGQGVTFDSCAFDHFGKYAFYCTNSTDCTVRNCSARTFSDGFHFGYDVHRFHLDTADITSLDNGVALVAAESGTYFQADDGLNGTLTDRNDITDCLFENVTAHGVPGLVRLIGPTGSAIVNNTFRHFRGSARTEANAIEIKDDYVPPPRDFALAGARISGNRFEDWEVVVPTAGYSVAAINASGFTDGAFADIQHRTSGNHFGPASSASMAISFEQPPQPNGRLHARRVEITRLISAAADPLTTRSTAGSTAQVIACHGTPDQTSIEQLVLDQCLFESVYSPQAFVLLDSSVRSVSLSRTTFHGLSNSFVPPNAIEFVSSGPPQRSTVVLSDVTFLNRLIDVAAVGPAAAVDVALNNVVFSDASGTQFTFSGVQGANLRVLGNCARYDGFSPNRPGIFFTTGATFSVNNRQARADIADPGMVPRQGDRCFNTDPRLAVPVGPVYFDAEFGWQKDWGARPALQGK